MGFSLISQPFSWHFRRISAIFLGILNGETAIGSSSEAELQGGRLGSQDLMLRAQGFELTLHHLRVIELRHCVKAIDISTSFHM